MTTPNIKIKIEISKRAFCFYALLNFSDYNPETSLIHPIRKKVRYFLEQNVPKKILPALEKITDREELRKEFWFPLRTWVLCHGQPPAFNEISSIWQTNLDAKTGKEFSQQLKIFWKMASPAWKTVEKDYYKIEKKCYSNAKVAVEICLSYLRLKETGIKDFIVIPNFLDEYNRGLGPKIGQTAYAIIGPSQKKDQFPVRRIQHEFLHSIINPITRDIFKNISKQKLSSMREYLIRGIILRSHRSNRTFYKGKISELKSSKYKNIEKIIMILEEYESSSKNFKDFLINNKVEIEKACLS